MKSRFVGALSLLFAFGALSTHPADAAVKYDVIDLGFFDGTSINSGGEVSGIGPTQFFGVANAYVWNGKFIDLGSLVVGATNGYGFASDAVRVDSLGRVYGTSVYVHTQNGDFRSAFVWNGKMHAVPHPAGAISCQATSANNVGEVVGLCYLGPPSNWHSFIYSHGVSRLFAPLGWEIDDVNSSGEILITDASGHFRLFSHGRYVVLKKSFFADKLNDAGISAGSLTSSQGSDAAYTDGTNYVDLGILPGFPFTNLSTLSLKGAGVGVASDGSGTQHALYYDATVGIIDLNGAIDPGQKFTLNQGIDINASGQILALGGPAGAPSSHTYVLTPRV